MAGLAEQYGSVWNKDKTHPPLYPPLRLGGINLEQHISNYEVDVLLLYQQYAEGKLQVSYVDMIMVINQVYRGANDETKWRYEYVLEIFLKVNLG